MAKTVDVFGFDEFEKEFKRCWKKYYDGNNAEADILLTTSGKQALKKVKQDTPVYSGSKKNGIKPGQLKRSWRLKPVKEYKGGTVKVVRIQSTAPHAHLVERGHEIYRGGKTRKNGKKMDAVQLSVRGIKHLGRVEGKYILGKVMEESGKKIPSLAQKALDKTFKELEV